MTTTKGRRFPPEPMTHEEVVRILAQCPATTTGRRDRALYATLYRAGLRVSEALDLMPKDLERHDGGCTIRVMHGKGDRMRVASMDEWGWYYLDIWLNERRYLGLGDKAHVFTTLTSHRLCHQQVSERLKELAVKAGVLKRANLHSLRHSHAVELLSEGQPIGVIQGQLGHASPVTTATYLGRLSNDTVMKAIFARPQPIDTYGRLEQP